MPTVSAIVPLYNPRPDYLDEALSSISSQSFNDVEAVVVNDGSTDKKYEAVLRKHSSLVRYTEQENQGVAGARNTGLAAARGKYVGFLDQDDRWHPRKLESQIELLEGNQGVDVVFHPINYINKDGVAKKLNTSHERRLKRRRHAGDILGELLKGNFIYSPTVLARKDCFDKVGGFDSNVDPHDDWDMWLRLAIAGFKFKALDEHLADWRVHPGNTSRDKHRMLRTRLAVIEKLGKEGLLPEKWRGHMNRMHAEYRITLAHSHYKERRYEKFREEIRTAYGIDWRSTMNAKILRRWCRSFVFERTRS
jgi:glycosyltransferase involved in cell wall biosynthesis